MDGLPPSEFRVLGEKCSARWTALGFTSLIIQIEGELCPKNSHKFTSWHSLDVRDERNRRMEFSTSSVIILNVICCFFWAFSLLWNIQKTKFSTSSVIMLQNCFLSLFNKKKLKYIFNQQFRSRSQIFKDIENFVCSGEWKISFHDCRWTYWTALRTWATGWLQVGHSLEVKESLTGFKLHVTMWTSEFIIKVMF